MSDLSKVSNEDLAAEVKRRKLLLRAQAWGKIEKLQKELYNLLYDHELLGMNWSSTSETIEEQTEEYFHDLWGACGGNDIYKILEGKK